MSLMPAGALILPVWITTQYMSAYVHIVIMEENIRPSAGQIDKIFTCFHWPSGRSPKCLALQPKFSKSVRCDTDRLFASISSRISSDCNPNDEPPSSFREGWILFIQHLSFAGYFLPTWPPCFFLPFLQQKLLRSQYCAVTEFHNDMRSWHADCSSIIIHWKSSNPSQKESSMWGQHSSNWGSNFCNFGSLFGHGPFFIGWLFPLLFWGIILFVLFSIVKSLFTGNRRSQNDSALETLRNRFASGEISESEFMAQKTVLSRKWYTIFKQWNSLYQLTKRDLPETSPTLITLQRHQLARS